MAVSYWIYTVKDGTTYKLCSLLTKTMEVSFSMSAVKLLLVICIFKQNFELHMAKVPFWIATYKRMGTAQYFSAILTKGDNFCDLFASLDNKILPKKGLFLKERSCFCRNKFFPLRVEPT